MKHIRGIIYSKRHIFSVLITFSLLFSSCKKNNDFSGHGPNCQGLTPLISITDPGLLDARFKEGTFWVYKDSVTSIIDSNTVVSATLSKTGFSGVCTQYEFYNIDIYRYGPTTIDRQVYFLSPSCLMYNIKSWDVGTKIYLGQNLIDNDQNVSHQWIDSLFVSGIYYKRVFKTTVQVDPAEGNQKSETYFNTQFGFLKINVYDTNNILKHKRILIRKNIIK